MGRCKSFFPNLGWNEVTRTEKVLAGATISLIVYELYTVVSKDKTDMISQEFWKNSVKRPVIPFALGMLVGHFVWQSDIVYEREITRIGEEGKIIEKLEVHGEGAGNSKVGMIREKGDRRMKERK